MNDYPDGRSRARGTSLADQDESQLGGPLSVLVRQKRGPVKLEHLLDELETTGEQQDRVLITICRLVFPPPVVSRRPPGNALAALPLTVLDNLRDLCAVTAHSQPSAADALRGSSGAWARAAGRIERLSIMRRDERSTTRRSA